MIMTGKNIVAGMSGVVVLSVLLIAGCSQEAENQAIAVPNNTRSMYTTSLPVELADGTVTSISKIGYPFYLIAFVDAPEGNPCYLSPDVQKVAEKVWLNSINVVQVTVPSKDMMFKEDVMNLCIPPKQNVVRVFDQDRRIWNLFNRPKAGTLMLVDQNGKIASTGTLADPKSVLFDTQNMSDEWNRRWNPTTNIETH